MNIYRKNGYKEGSFKFWLSFYEKEYKDFFLLIHPKANNCDYINHLKSETEHLKIHSDGTESAINQLNAMEKYVSMNE